MTALAAAVPSDWNGDVNAAAFSSRRAPSRTRGFLIVNEAGTTNVPNTSSLTDVRSDSDWLGPTVTKLASLLSLPFGWDGGRGQPVSAEVAIYAVSLLIETMPRRAVAPHLVPLAGGGLGIEWHRNGLDVELIIPRAGSVDAFWEDLATGIETERSYTIDFRELADPITRAASRT